jgi:predicted Rossmann fold flavoprotein
MYDVIILGAGAAGLMCAAIASKRGRSVLVLERNQNIGEKIRISGGGRCNFTNVIATPDHYLSDNPHFCKSALARFTPDDFVALVTKHSIAYHEKTLGQLFCDGSSRQIIDMLQKECDEGGVEIVVGCYVSDVQKREKFIVTTPDAVFECESLVVATGGLSIPKLGATDFGYRLAKAFGLQLSITRPGLVPLTFRKEDLSFFGTLSGVSLDAIVSCNGRAFRENILFTHRGLSGPAILQASSYWNRGNTIAIDLSPDVDLLEYLKERHQSVAELATVLSGVLPNRLAKQWCNRYVPTKPLLHFSFKELSSIAHELHDWKVIPQGTEGYSKAEVTCGGVDTKELSSKTMEAKKVKGLYFVGEVVDVTGHLGGYNFQWAWASGFVAGGYA